MDAQFLLNDFLVLDFFWPPFYLNNFQNHYCQFLIASHL